MFVEKLAFGADFSTILHLDEDLVKSEPTTNESSSTKWLHLCDCLCTQICDQANRNSKFSRLQIFEEFELISSNIET